MPHHLPLGSPPPAALCPPESYLNYSWRDYDKIVPARVERIAPDCFRVRIGQQPQWIYCTAGELAEVLGAMSVPTEETRRRRRRMPTQPLAVALPISAEMAAEIDDALADLFPI